jgi:hypothetical protein
MTHSIKQILEGSKLDLEHPMQWHIDHIARLLGEEAMNAPINVLAVDGDIIAYRTAAVCENDFEGACSQIIDNTLREISTQTGIGHMRIYLSGENNFRYD